MYAIVRFVVGLLFRVFTDLEIAGAENVPAAGPVLVTTNHLSQTDPPLLLVAIPRRVRVFAARKYRRNPFLLVLFEGMGCIWVRQAEADAEALKAALTYLRSGGALGLSPEGTRSRGTHALQRALPGTAYLASRSDALIVPVALWGTEDVVRNLLRFRRTRVRVQFGKAFNPGIPARAKGAELEAGVDDIMCAVAALLPPQYRGYYAAHPRLAYWLEQTGA